MTTLTPHWNDRSDKPDGPQDLSGAKKWANWWGYHWGFVVFAAIIVIGGISLARDMFFRPRPDYEIGYVGRAPLPAGVRTALQEQLASLGHDVNGDGEVLVEIDAYEIGFDEEGMMDVEAATAATTGLTVDLSSGGMYLLLLDDPEGFQSRMGALSYLDGTVPPAGDASFGASGWRDMVYKWNRCPVLRGLPLGTYSQFGDEEGEERDAQSFLSGLYIGRRALRDDEQRERFAADAILWDALTSGAEAE